MSSEHSESTAKISMMSFNLNRFQSCGNTPRLSVCVLGPVGSRDVMIPVEGPGNV